jgi:hypothetical protein
MSVWVDAATAATGLNVLLLAVLGYVWGRNFVELRSKHTAGLVVFAAILLAENALALYYYLVDPTLSVWYATQAPTVVWQATMVLHVLEFVAVAVLTWITWD